MLRGLHQGAFSAIDRDDAGTFFVLLSSGLDIDSRDSRGRTLLLAACDHPQDRQAFIAALLARKPDLNAADGTGRTALHALCDREDVNVAQLRQLLSQPLALAAADCDGAAALHRLARRGWTEGISELLAAAPRAAPLLEQTDRHGRTPLWLAGEHAAAFCLLLSHGADPRAADAAGVRALERVEDREARALAVATALARDEAEALRPSLAEPEFDDLRQASKAALARDFLSSVTAPMRLVPRPD